MSNETKNKVLEALSALVPEQDRLKVESVVNEFLDSTVQALEAEYEKNLEEAYATVAEEKVNDEKVAIQGYNEAYEIITDLKNRLESQREEYENQLEEGYGEFYEMLLAERKKNEDLENKLNDHYKAKLDETYEYLVDQIDAFLANEADTLRESVKQEVLSDPNLLEHKLAWDKVLNLASDWLSDEDYSSSSNKKIEELKKQLSESVSKTQILEAKNTKLTLERDRLNEEVRGSKKVLTESVEKERLERRKTVEGKGLVEVAKDRHEVVVLKEEASPVKEPAARINESSDIESQWRQLAFGGDNK